MNAFKSREQLLNSGTSHRECTGDATMNEKLNLSLDEFETLADFIYQKTGIKFEYKKEQLVSNRLIKRLEATGEKSVMDYIRLLKFRDRKSAEFQNLINSLTVNETYFFRDFPQLTSFADYSLTELVNRKIQSGSNTLNIWSVGCSSGEEPYTLAIILSEILEDIGKWQVKITASDIDLNILAKARSGEYSARSIKDVPDIYLNNYFHKKDGLNCINQEIKKHVTFEHLNLMDKISMRKHVNYDIIFCRNVLIYFDELSRKQVVDNFYSALNKGGYIFLGSSESIGKISNAFKLNKMGNYLIYSKE